MRILQNDQFVPQPTPPPLDHGEVHVWFFPHWANARDSATSLPVREWLAQYLGVDTSDVQIEAESNGKPRLRGGKLHFNISHSGGALMLAVSRDQEIGIDLEFSRRPRRVVELARRWFDSAEADALQALPEASRQNAFLRLWTCKEAVLKADGSGISSGLHRVTFEMNEVGEIDEVTDSAWRVVRLEPAPGYVGAVAWKGPDRPVRTFISAAR